jgi:hypothetical protein
MVGFHDRGARRRIGQYGEHAERAKVRQGVALGRLQDAILDPLTAVLNALAGQSVRAELSL